MRPFMSILLFVCMGLFATEAKAAVSFNIIRTSVSTGHALDALEFGDEVTIDIRMTNPTGAPIVGVGAGVQGWDEGVATFVSGEINQGPYFCTQPACDDGLPNLERNLHPTNADVRVIPDFPPYPGLPSYVSLVQAIILPESPAVGDGTRDPGLDGIVGGGDAQFRILFRMVGAPGSQTLIDIGNNPNPIVGNVVILAGAPTWVLGTNASLTLTMVPEPGTALLMALGLAGLATSGRRS